MCYNCIIVCRKHNVVGVKAQNIDLTGNTTFNSVQSQVNNAIASTVIEYALSDSATTEPTSGWSTTAPTWQADRYMWQRTTITYTDTTKDAIVTTTCIQGAVGTPGLDGKSISTITEYYLASASSTGVTTSTSGWNTTITSPTADEPYLWNYEVSKYDDGTTASTTDPVVIAYYTEDGDPGRGIDNIVNYYLVTSVNNITKDTIDNYTWQTTPDATSTTNKYLWNYEVISYTDGTFKTTDPAIIGTHGETGLTGVSITGVSTQYCLSDSNETPPTSGWTTDFKSIMATYWDQTATNNKYIWRREEISYSDGRNPEHTDATVDTGSSAVAQWCDENDKTVINGANIATGTIDTVQLNANAITAEKIATDAITSRNYYTKDENGNYTTTKSGEGMKLNLSDGTWDSEHFKIDSVGAVTATEGNIANWLISEDKLSNRWMDDQGLYNYNDAYFESYGEGKGWTIIHGADLSLRSISTSTRTSNSVYSDTSTSVEEALGNGSIDGLHFTRTYAKGSNGAGGNQLVGRIGWWYGAEFTDGLKQVIAPFKIGASYLVLGEDGGNVSIRGTVDVIEDLKARISQLEERVEQLEDILNT